AARYWLPSCVGSVVKLRVVFVAPAMSVKVMPPLVLTCHCTLGAGLVSDAAVKDTSAPATTAWSVGDVGVCRPGLERSDRVCVPALFASPRNPPPGAATPNSSCMLFRSEEWVYSRVLLKASPLASGEMTTSGRVNDDESPPSVSSNQITIAPLFL